MFDTLESLLTKNQIYYKYASNEWYYLHFYCISKENESIPIWLKNLLYIFYEDLIIVRPTELRPIDIYVEKD